MEAALRPNCSPFHYLPCRWCWCICRGASAASLLHPLQPTPPLSTKSCPPCLLPLSPPFSLPSLVVDNEQQLTRAAALDAAGTQKDAKPLPCHRLCSCLSPLLSLLQPRGCLPGGPSVVSPFCSFCVIHLLIYLLLSELVSVAPGPHGAAPGSMLLLSEHKQNWHQQSAGMESVWLSLHAVGREWHGEEPGHYSGCNSTTMAVSSCCRASRN